MKNLGKKGLSMNQAQSISNLCNQIATDIDTTINNFNVTSKTIKVDKETYVVKEANPIVDIHNLLSYKSKLHGVQAHIMEAIKAKDALLNSIQNEGFDDSIFTMPERKLIYEPELISEVGEDYGWKQLSETEYAEYLEQEAIASHYGQFIHKRGKLSCLRNELAKFASLEWEVIEDGKKTPVKVAKHHTQDELMNIHNEVSDVHTRANQRVNYFKAKAKNLANAKNIEIHKENARLKMIYQSNLNDANAEYQNQLAAYNNMIEEMSETFYADRLKRLNEASKLKVVIDPRFQSVVDELIVKQ